MIGYFRLVKGYAPQGEKLLWKYEEICNFRFFPWSKLPIKCDILAVETEELISLLCFLISVFRNLFYDPSLLGFFKLYKIVGIQEQESYHPVLPGHQGNPFNLAHTRSPLLYLISTSSGAEWSSPPTPHTLLVSSVFMVHTQNSGTCEVYLYMLV